MNTRPRLRSRQLNLSLTQAEFEALEEWAFEKGITRNSAARSILVLQLDQLSPGLEDARKKELADAGMAKKKCRPKRRPKR